MAVVRVPSLKRSRLPELRKPLFYCVSSFHKLGTQLFPKNVPIGLSGGIAAEIKPRLGFGSSKDTGPFLSKYATESEWLRFSVSAPHYHDTKKGSTNRG
eukprot:241495_1